jgi:glycosyltransferase involved in cell wall biosynthesis
VILTSSHVSPASERPFPAEARTSLADVTLFRFAHMFRHHAAGGMERYLADLNRRLLERNRMRILQMYLTDSKSPRTPTTERMGMGELVWIPSILMGPAHPPPRLRDQLWEAAKRRLGVPLISHDALLSTLRGCEVNLAVFHWISPDSSVVLRHFARAGTPFAVVNHFENSRLSRPLIKKQISHARAVSGVSGVGVPTFLASRFTNLSDGIDTDFFDPAKATSLRSAFIGGLILLPSRVIEGKGHLDALRALIGLLKQGVNATLAFAGRIERSGLVDTLTDEIRARGIERHIIWAGELSQTDLRNWYAASDVVVFPTSAEGLGRVLLEAQAMKRAVVAYDVGGVREAVLHGKSGYLVGHGDAADLERRVKELLTDPGARRELGERGREHVVKSFSLDALTTRHEAFYARVLDAEDARSKSTLHRE